MHLLLVALKLYFAFVVAAATVAISQADFTTLATALLAFLLPLGLQFWPAAWSGARMALIAHIGSGLLAILGLYLTGQLTPFDPGKLTLYVGAYVGATQFFYSIFKDRWHLADPPGIANPSPHTQVAADIGVTQAVPPPAPVA
jgi:hypothetical protein